MYEYKDYKLYLLIIMDSKRHYLNSFRFIRKLKVKNCLVYYFISTLLKF